MLYGDASRYKTKPSDLTVTVSAMAHEGSALSYSMLQTQFLSRRVWGDHDGRLERFWWTAGRPQAVAVDGRTAEGQGRAFLWWSAYHGLARAHRCALCPRVSPSSRVQIVLAALPSQTVHHRAESPIA